MQTGENEQGLRKILDMTRMISIVILALHFYYACYRSFEVWGFTMQLTDRLLINIKRTGLFDRFIVAKLMALGFLVISLIGAKGRKDEGLNYKTALAYIVPGLSIYFVSYFSLLLSLDNQTITIVYIATTSLGFILVLTGGTLLSRIISMHLLTRIFSTRRTKHFPRKNGYSKISIPSIFRRNII